MSQSSQATALSVHSTAFEQKPQGEVGLGGGVFNIVGEENKEENQLPDECEGQSVGALSPVNHKGLHQG